MAGGETLYRFTGNGCLGLDVRPGGLNLPREQGPWAYVTRVQLDKMTDRDWARTGFPKEVVMEALTMDGCFVGPLPKLDAVGPAVEDA